MNNGSETSLRAFNTFGIDVNAKRIIRVKDNAEWRSLKEEFNGIYDAEHLVLGGGSNVLLTGDFEGVVLINQVKGLELLEETEEYWLVEACGGEEWHELVMWTLDKGMHGIENMSLIPGSVGAAPMQNIGAYGVELKDVFYSLTAFEKSTGEFVSFSKDQCEFGYRSSVFKTRLKGEYIITSVRLKLSKGNKLNTSYGAIESQLSSMSYNALNAKVISDAVIAIRESKLPNPKEIGNGGSFFKNPIIEESIATELKEVFPNMPVYQASTGYSKVAAGWLIEQCGWKGYVKDNRYGVHKKQALVLVNYSDAKGSEIYDLSERIIEDVNHKFGIQLEREINVI